MSNHRFSNRREVRAGLGGGSPPTDYRERHRKAAKVLTELLAQDKRAEANHEEFLSTEERWALHHAVGTLEAACRITSPPPRLGPPPLPPKKD